MNPLLMERQNTFAAERQNAFAADRQNTFAADWSGTPLEIEPSGNANAAELRDENRRLRRVINRLRAERQTLCDALRKTW